MPKTGVEAGAQIGTGPTFWARVAGSVYSVINLMAWGPDGSEVVVDDAPGYRLPVSFSPATATAGTVDGSGALVAGAATLPDQPTAKRRYVQNLDVAPLRLTFDGGAVVWLEPAGAQDYPGGKWDDGGSPAYLGAIQLFSTIATGHFAAGFFA